MRILHTSDWHAGRNWKGRDRLPELQDILEHLGDFIEHERIDLVLMTGDVYDTSVPSAEAERTVTTFFKRMGRAGIPSVVIAGNHDSAARLESWGMLAEFVGVHARGVPRRAAAGGVINLETRSGERACIAALPFAAAGRLVEALTVARDETLARQQYASLMQELMSQLSAGFSAGTVNLVLAHTDVSGAVYSGSERLANIGDSWAATTQALPSRAQYVALGHIHRPQPLHAAAPTRYAGSPMQLDFGELGEEKSFVVVEVAPGMPARLTTEPYHSVRQLGEFQGTWPELEARVDELRTYGYLRVQLTLDAPDADLNRRARRLLENIVSVDVRHPAVDQGDDTTPPTTGVAPREHFAAFHLQTHQREAASESLALFDELYAAASHED